MTVKHVTAPSVNALISKDPLHPADCHRTDRLPSAPSSSFGREAKVKSLSPCLQLLVIIGTAIHQIIISTVPVKVPYPYKVDGASFLDGDDLGGACVALCEDGIPFLEGEAAVRSSCLLYTSDAADD